MYNKHLSKLLYEQMRTYRSVHWSSARVQVEKVKSSNWDGVPNPTRPRENGQAILNLQNP